MGVFSVKFEISSSYEDESEDFNVFIIQDIELENLDSLFSLLDDSNYIDSLDDTCSYNPVAESRLITTTLEYVEIKDNKGKVVYKD